MTQPLPPLPHNMTHLPRDHRGFPVPWFVQWFADGKPSLPGTGAPDFRVIDTPKFVRAIRHRLCWVCGGPLGRYQAFVIGPMCAVNRTTSEPPSHRDCAIFAVRACPFLSRPRMKRNAKDVPTTTVEPPGLHLDRNPGAACVWIGKTWSVFRAGVGESGVLIKLGNPEEVLWFVEGRPASRAEIMASIDGGYPALLALAELEGPDAVRELGTLRERAERLLPAA